MIKLHNLSFQYGTEQSRGMQLKNINLHIKQGEFVLLTGSSGCGKTTLTRVLNGLCPQFYTGTLTGSYLLNGLDATKTAVSEIGSIVGSVFQDPRSQFYATNTTDEIVLGMENHALHREEMVMRLKETCTQIGVESLMDRSIFPLSSGEKQRIALASVCAMRPKVLVLDEPSANLDSDAIAKLSTLLYRLKESGITIVLSEHRLHYARDFFDRMIIMANGEVTAEYAREKALALKTSELKSMGLRLFTEPTLEPGKRIAETDNAYVRAYQLSIAFEGKSVLDEVNFTAQKGQVLAISGSNGAGKTSLCRVITGLYKQNIGQVFFGDNPLKWKHRIMSSFFVQQDTDYQLYAATIEDEFRVGKRNKAMSKERINNLLKSVGLDNMIERHPLSLSGGQKQRLLLALSIASGKDILVLDEPTSGLDGCNMLITAELIKKLAQAGKCVILITHDLELINHAADSLLYMDSGKISYHRSIQRPSNAFGGEESLL